MDYLERYQAEQEAVQALHERSPHATRADEETRPRTDMRAEDYPVTVIGCVRGIDGWYRAGYDERTKTIKPMERIP